MSRQKNQIKYKIGRCTNGHLLLIYYSPSDYHTYFTWNIGRSNQLTTKINTFSVYTEKSDQNIKRGIHKWLPLLIYYYQLSKPNQKYSLSKLLHPLHHISRRLTLMINSDSKNWNQLQVVSSHSKVLYVSSVQTWVP